MNNYEILSLLGGSDSSEEVCYNYEDAVKFYEEFYRRWRIRKKNGRIYAITRKNKIDGLPVYDSDEKIFWTDKESREKHRKWFRSQDPVSKKQISFTE